jgi:hypothetical protein
MKRYLLLLLVLIVGCAGIPKISTDTALPEAYSDETYSATIKGVGGTAPYTCAGPPIGGTLTISRDCRIDGTAPTAIDKKIIPFTVNITDANGRSSILSLHLTVNPPPLKLVLPDEITFPIGEQQSVTFTGASNGKKPYTFFVKGQPMGLMLVNNVLAGTVPESALRKDYPIEVCVKDITGSQVCENTVIKLIEKKRYKLDVTVSGPGTVSGNDQAEYEEGTVVTLTADGTAFKGWSGACSGTGNCLLTMDSDKKVTALFEKKTTWNILVEGPGRYSDTTYGISYGSAGNFLFDGNKATASGKGEVAVEQDYADCKGSGEYSPTFSVRGTVSDGWLEFELYDSNPSMLKYDLECVGAYGYATVPSPFDTNGEKLRVELAKGAKSEKKISIPGEHAREFIWAVSVLG